MHNDGEEAKPDLTGQRRYSCSKWKNLVLKLCCSSQCKLSSFNMAAASQDSDDIKILDLHSNSPLDPFPDRGLCHFCRKIQWRHPSPTPRRARFVARFGTILDIFSRRSCTLCGMVLSLILKGKSILDLIHFSGDISSIDFVDLAKEYLIHFQFWYSNHVLSPGHLEAPKCIEIAVFREKEIMGTIQTLEVDKEDMYHSGERRLRDEFITGCGSPIQSQMDINTIKRWLKQCDERHIRCQALDVVRDDGALHYVCGGDQNLKQQAFNFIDVLHGCISEHCLPVKYAALSYVWGPHHFLKANTENFASLSQSGGLYLQTEPVPSVIKDALSVVAALGIPYLWVDSLCIIQDDKDSLEKKIKHMDLIYSAASLTIVALSGAYADFPLPGVCANTRESQSFTELYRLKLAVSPPTVLDILKTSTSESRGWTLQERLLSRRCLLFSDHEIFFSCQMGIERESGFCHALDVINNPLTSLKTECIEGLDDENLDPFFEAYEDILDLYTRRKLSVQSDVDNAFRGISNTLERFTRSPFISGIPIILLDYALLWKPTVENFGRACTGNPRREATSNTLRHPSWSWMSWNGPANGLLDLVQNLCGPRNPIIKSDIEKFTVHESCYVYELGRFAGATEIRCLRPARYCCRNKIASEVNLPVVTHRALLKFRAQVIDLAFLRIEQYGGQPGSGIVQLETLSNDCCGILYHESENRIEDSKIPARLILLSSLAQYRILCSPAKGNGLLPEFACWSEKYRPRTSDEILNIMLSMDAGDHFERLAVGHIAKSAWETYESWKEDIRLG